MVLELALEEYWHLRGAREACCMEMPGNLLSGIEYMLINICLCMLFVNLSIETSLDVIIESSYRGNLPGHPPILVPCVLGQWN